MRTAAILASLILLAAATAIVSQHIATGDDALGTREYDDYEKPGTCGSCHTDIYQQWTQAMMSQAYTHHWDEIEYFDLAVPHAELDEVVAGVKKQALHLFPEKEETFDLIYLPRFQRLLRDKYRLH